MYTAIDPRVVRDIPRSHDVYGRLLASVNGSSFTYPITMETGTVSVSGSSAIRRKLKATINAKIDDAECDVFCTEIRAEYGIRILTGETLWTPVGTFVITDAVEIAEGKIEITGEDRWRRIVNARFLQPVATSGPTVAAISSLVTTADGRISFINDTTNTNSHPSSIWERDRDTSIMALAKSIGAVVYLDVMGDAHLANVRGVGEKPDWQVGGGDGGVLILVGRGRSQGNTYNAVVVEAENSTGVVSIRATAVISGAGSPILYGGPFARRPRYYRTALINTTLQAQQVALSLLARVSGTAKTVAVSTLPHPGLDAGDIIRIEVEPAVWESHIVDMFDINLGPGPIAIGTRTGLTTGDEAELQ